jgi:hypothetical protein
LAKREVVGYRSALSTQAIAETFKRVIEESIGIRDKVNAKLVWGRPQRDSEDPFTDFQDRPDFSALAGMTPRVKPAHVPDGYLIWTIHCYVFDEGTDRRIEFARMGDIGARRVAAKKLDAVVRALHSQDPNLRPA